MNKFFLRLLLMVVGLITSSGAWADLTTGYYTLKNVGYDGYYMYEDFTSSCVRATSTAYSSGDYEKVWKITVSGSNVTMQNVYTGHYIQTQSSTSATYTTGSTSASFALTTNSDGSYCFGTHMHCDGSKNIVQWNESSNTHSWWVATAVSLTDDEVTAAQAEYNASATINTNRSTYNTALAKFFTDLSCSELNSTYSGYTETNLKTAMANEGLPTSIQNVGASVLNQWSSETDPAIVKQFRVQTYKPYTRAYYARNQLNATQFNDMSNPTGIYANAKKELLVFVGGTIPDGCTLRIAGGTGNTLLTYTAGTELQQGVNAIKASADYTQFWIMYTYTSDTQVDMSTLSSLKIHIEGGTVLGYVNAADKTESEINTEYKKILTHANTVTTDNSVDDGNVNFVVKGNRGVFFFPLDTYNAIWAGTNYSSNTYNTYEIGKSIDFFDSVLKWEWSVMGHMKRVVDGECDPTQHSDTHENLTGGQSLYPTYYNNLALTLQGASGSNPFSTTGYTSMPAVSGVESSYNAERVNFDNWCVGHESGHNNQGLINLPSSTESSNNLFSNVIQYQWGYRMSRGASVADANSYYVDGTQFALRDIGTTHRMYWQLYLYFHVAKNNTAFYPTFFNLLRDDPMDLSSGTCFTKFYEKACEAAKQDLTSFFTVWGFLQPFENTTFGDYTSRTLTLTQTEIDEAKARVAALVADGTYKSDNLDIMFIEDRTETATRWDPFSTGTEQKVNSDGGTVTAASLASSYGTMGSVSSMTSGSTSSTTGSFVYSITDGTLNLDGTSAGAGVIVYDKSGNIVAYGNSSPISLPSSITDYDQIVVKSVASDGTVVELESVVEAGTDEQQLAVLQELLDKANTMLATTDDTNTKVGFYKSSYLTDLKTLVSQANTAITNSATSSYKSLIVSLNREISSIESLVDATVNIVSGNSYSLRNVNYSTKYITVTSENKLATTTSVSDTEKWTIEAAGDGKYYIKNMSTGYYISTLGTSTQATAVATSTDDAFKFSIESKGNGTWALNSNASEGSTYLHCEGWYNNIVGWDASATTSHWYITQVEESTVGADLSKLQSLVDQTQVLVDKAVATYSFAAGTSTAESLQTSSSSTAFYITTNHDESVEGNNKEAHGIAYICDNSTTTFFHSTWSANTTDKHYWQVDCGSGNELDYFTFSFSTRPNGANWPSNLTVSGSNDNTNFTPITTLSISGLSTSAQSTYTSDVIGNGIPYRYLRFTVNNTVSGNGSCAYTHSYYFFALAEFDLNDVTRTFTMTANDGFSSVTSSKVEAAVTNIEKSEALMSTSTVTTTELEAEYTTLKAAYDALKTEVDAAEKDPYKTQLETLIANTNTLLGTVMEDGYTYSSGETTSLTMQTTDSSAPYYVSTNHDESVEGSKSLTADAVGIKNLVDGSSSTYFHSTWSTATTDQHYWQIDLGSGNDVDVFSFSITPESDHTGNFPNDIIVQGSTDGNTFTQVTELTSSSTPALPSSASTATYTSGTITSSTAYRYWRFVVNGTVSGNGNCSFSHTYKFFALTEFTMTVGNPIQSLTGTKKTGYESVSDELVITAASEKDDATLMISDANYSSTSASALKYQVTALQNAYDALNTEKQKADLKAEITTLMASMTTLLNSVATDGTLNSQYSSIETEYTDATTAQTAATTITTTGYDDATVATLTTAKTNLQTAYDALVAAKKTVDESVTGNDVTNMALDDSSVPGLSASTMSVNGHFAMVPVSQNNAMNYHWYSGIGSTSTTLTTDYLLQLESNGTSGQYYLKSYDGKYFCCANATPAENDAVVKNDGTSSNKMSFTLSTGTSSDGDNANNFSSYSSQWVKFTTVANNAVWLNCQTDGVGKYNKGTGGYTAFAVFGPYYVATISYQLSDGTVISTDTHIVEANTTLTPTAPTGYTLSSSSTLKVTNADKTFTVTVTPKTYDFDNAIVTAVSDNLTDVSSISTTKYYVLYDQGTSAYNWENSSNALKQSTKSTLVGLYNDDLTFLVQFEKVSDGVYRIKNPVTGNYYGTFGSSNSQAVSTTTDNTTTVNITYNTDNSCFYLQDATTSYYLNGQGNGYNVVGWQTELADVGDNGKYQIKEVTLADVATITLNYVLSSDATVTKSATQVVAVGTIPTVTMDYATCTLTPQEAATANKAYTVTVTEDLPFQTSTDFDNAIWHTMDIHSYNGGRHVWTYTAENADITLSTTESVNDMTQTQLGDSKQWCFVGNLLEGFYIYNKAAGSTMKLYKATTGQTKSCMSSSNGTKFFLVQTNDTYRIDGGFCLLADGDTHYLNHQSGVINGWGDNDAGSTCRAFLSIESAWTQELATAAANNTAEANWMNAIGYLDATAHTTMVNTYAEYDDVESTGCTYDQLTALKAANEAYENATVMSIVDGKKYIIRSAYIDSNNNAINALSATYGTTSNFGWEAMNEEDPDQYWTLTKTADNQYSFYSDSQKKYITGISSMGETSTAIDVNNYGSTTTKFTLNIHGATTSDDDASHIYFHGRYMSSQGYTSGEIIQWGPSAEASAWYIIPAPDVTVASSTATAGTITGYISSAESAATVLGLQATAASDAVTNISSIDLTGATLASGVTVEDIQTAINAKTENANTIYYVANGVSDKNSSDTQLNNIAVQNENKTGYVCTSLVLADKSAFAASKAFTATSVSYTRTIAADANNYGTVCLPYAVESNDDVQYMKIVSGTSSALRFEYVDEVEANTPALFKRKNTGNLEATASNVDIPVVTEQPTQSVTDWKLVGVYKSTSVVSSEGTDVYATGFDKIVDANSYYIKSGKFYSINGRFNLNSFRAYISAVSTQARMSMMDIEESIGETTGVQIIDNEKDGTLDMIFDINGRRRDTLQKGINIINGKKVIK